MIKNVFVKKVNELQIVIMNVTSYLIIIVFLKKIKTAFKSLKGKHSESKIFQNGYGKTVNNYYIVNEHFIRIKTWISNLMRTTRF